MTALSHVAPAPFHTASCLPLTPPSRSPSHSPQPTVPPPLDAAFASSDPHVPPPLVVARVHYPRQGRRSPEERSAASPTPPRPGSTPARCSTLPSMRSRWRPGTPRWSDVSASRGNREPLHRRHCPRGAEVFCGLQSARKESRSVGASVLEDQVHQIPLRFLKSPFISWRYCV